MNHRASRPNGFGTCNFGLVPSASTVPEDPPLANGSAGSLLISLNPLRRSSTVFLYRQATVRPCRYSFSRKISIIGPLPNSIFRTRVASLREWIDTPAIHL